MGHSVVHKFATWCVPAFIWVVESGEQTKNKHDQKKISEHIVKHDFSEASMLKIFNVEGGDGQEQIWPWGGWR